MLRGKVTPAGCALALATALAASNGTAQSDQADTLEEIVVTARTGSRISRQSDSPSPLSSYEGGDLVDAGLKDIRDMVGVLSINAGAENNSDNLTQNYTVGTANINLRGTGRRLHFSARERQEAGAFLGADRRRFELRGPGGAGAHALRRSAWRY